MLINTIDMINWNWNMCTLLLLFRFSLKGNVKKKGKKDETLSAALQTRHYVPLKNKYQETSTVCHLSSPLQDTGAVWPWWPCLLTPPPPCLINTKPTQTHTVVQCMLQYCWHRVWRSRSPACIATATLDLSCCWLAAT